MRGLNRSRMLHANPSHIHNDSFHKKSQEHTEDTHSRVVLAPSILYLSLFLSASIAFGIGWTSRIALVVSNFEEKMDLEPASSPKSPLVVKKSALSVSTFNESFEVLFGAYIDETPHSDQEDAEIEANEPTPALPVPQVISGKTVPLTRYTWEEFPAPGSAEGNTVHIDRSTSGNVATQPKHDNTKPMISFVTANSSSNDVAEETAFEDEEVHLPSGQHLLIDIRHVSPSFLNSQHALATAMITLINESELTLLSYHCHSLVPVGVSCAGVLLESHIAFHTWPTEGVITLDLFTCGAKPLIPIVGSIERLFAVPPTLEERLAYGGKLNGNPLETSMVWSHKLRGFREEFSEGYDSMDNPLDYGLGHEVLNRLTFDLKDEVVSTATKFQHVDIFDVMEVPFRSYAFYQKSIARADDEITDSYEYCHPELFKPDRVLYLGGVLQSSFLGDAPYHEALVHPVMIAHHNPRRVAIIGGGEGATLREVLKHNTVEEVVMIDIDEELISLAKEHLKEWNDCSDLIDSNVQSCFDHPKASIYFCDAMKWFIDRFNDKSNDEMKFDVIIMDALDPNDAVDIVDELYTNTTFLQSLYNGLHDDGAFIVQLGEAPRLKSPPDEYGSFQNRARVIHTLESLGMETMHPYAEGHSGFFAPWTYLGAFRDGSMRSTWYRNPTEVDLQIEQRIFKTKSGSNPLRYFDGTSMQNYQIPPKSFEAIQCLIRPVECSVSNTESTRRVYSPFYERRFSYAKSARSKQASYNLDDVNTSDEELMKITDRSGKMDFRRKSYSSSLLFSRGLIGDVSNGPNTKAVVTRKVTTSV
mmetsp:Transcript_5167/g.11371  ORF Transcript_5167/g.11371 Transcript_5167/m.11371 type:complete len:813 (+) Transcript_5167:404-2842(+)